MRDVIVILEDNLERTASMRKALEDANITVESRFFRVPCEMIDWFRINLSRVLLASLDHDMNDLNAPERDQTGMEVISHLIANSPSFPVIVHTSNGTARVAMCALLRKKKWKVRVEAPYEDMLWIRESWIKTVTRLLKKERNSP